LAIAWTLYTKGVASAICGSKNPEQAISNAKAADIDLTQDDILEINKITENISIYELITPKRFS
jgi:aryl-alcohol dehydrogenase-like predicted oxidoreductase